MTGHLAPTRQSTEFQGELSALAAAAHPDLLAGCRAIQPGDEHALSASEAAPLAGAIVSVRRASGAARIVARTLLTRLGSPSSELPRLRSGATRWPAGVVGSMAHDGDFAVAAVVPARALVSIGIDVEPALPLAPELVDVVATRREREELQGDLVCARLLFCIKEAVYKATHPYDGFFLEHHDVEVRMDAGLARTRTGRRLRIQTIIRPRLVALATLERDHAGRREH